MNEWELIPTFPGEDLDRVDETKNPSAFSSHTELDTYNCLKLEPGCFDDRVLLKPAIILMTWFQKKLIYMYVNLS